MTFRMVCFYCSHSGEDALDLSGREHLSYPSTVVGVRLPCSGRVEERIMLKAFREGADAVLILGCLEGNCHYLFGNIEARKRVERTKRILDVIGLGGERLEIVNVAPNQGWKLPEMVKEMESRVEKLGRNPLGVERHDHR